MCAPNDCEMKMMNFLSPLQVKTPIVNSKTKMLAPGLPGHQAPVKGTSQASEKRKKDTDSKEVCQVLLTVGL